MIEVAGLRVVLPPSTVALHDIDLSIARGEFVVVLGRSGAGKTTFLRCLNRLVEPTSGTIRVAGRTVTGAGPIEVREIRRQIGMDDTGEIASAAAMAMMIFYTNVAARMLHLLLARWLTRRTQAWRQR